MCKETHVAQGSDVRVPVKAAGSSVCTLEVVFQVYACMAVRKPPVLCAQGRSGTPEGPCCHDHG